ncbi:putative membrane protein YesL [Arthrobacter pigmenti]|uniref:Putative membrane protein YesL n=1 Tax=Arthrobacter pigmenti TaxID=271432 RepID=A0A846RJR5_9MICC|nr:DUF624 domain-containing protein [Arthrobacter pigmenti]NJC21389.1 putative membrane protein YesL [Arthrobacter pigmenti]
MTEYPGWAGRLMDWLRFGMQLVLLNLLFLAGTFAGLGIFGLFPSAVATTVLLARLRSGDPGDRLISDYLTAYRAQFIHANKVGSLFWLAALLAVANARLVFDPAWTHPAWLFLSVVAIIASVTVGVSAAAAVVVCSRYRDTVRRTWRLALILPLASPVMTITWLVSLGALGVLFAGVGALVPLVGASLPLLVSGVVIGHRLGALLPNDDGADAADQPPGRSHQLTIAA